MESKSKAERYADRLRRELNRKCEKRWKGQLVVSKGSQRERTREREEGHYAVTVSLPKGGWILSAVVRDTGFMFAPTTEKKDARHEASHHDEHTLDEAGYQEVIRKFFDGMRDYIEAHMTTV